MSERNDIRKELHSYKLDYDLIKKKPCTEEENQTYSKMLKEGKELPKGVFLYSDDTECGEFYTVYEPDLTQEEINEYLTFKKLELLKTIKNCAVFFTVLTIISLISSLLFLIVR